jgi:hypothetical protein
MYKLIENIQTGQTVAVEIVGKNTSFLLDPANSDYRQFLDDINDQGTEIVEGDIPESVLEHAAQRKFQQQLNKYAQAVARLDKYLLSEGRPEVKQMLPMGETKYNPATLEYETSLIEVITQTEVEPLPATVDVWEEVEGEALPAKKTIRNPLIVKDEAERAAAQVIVDATPEEVKVAAAGE